MYYFSHMIKKYLQKEVDKLYLLFNYENKDKVDQI